MHSHKKKQHIRMFGKTSAPLHCNSIINMQTKKWEKGQQTPNPKLPITVDMHFKQVVYIN